MLSPFGIEVPRPILFALAFVIILAVVVILAIVLRRLTGGRLMMGGQDRSRARQPRLGVVDIYDLDRQRQLVLLRRDNVEHLLLIGGLNDVVIETNIVRVAGARIPAPAAEQGAERFEPAFEQAARPQVESPGRPSIETQLAAQLGAFVKRPSDEPEAEDDAFSPRSSGRRTSVCALEPLQKPDAMTASRTVFPDVYQAEPREQPIPPVSVQSEPASAEPPPVRPEPRAPYMPPPFQSRPTPQLPAPPAPVQPVFFQPEFRQPEIRQPEPAPQAAPATPDAAVLSDMAKQLEEALKRPAGAAFGSEPGPVRVASTLMDHKDDLDEDDLLEPSASQGEAEEDEVATPLEVVSIRDEVETDIVFAEQELQEEPEEEPEAPAPALKPQAPAPASTHPTQVAENAAPAAPKEKLPDPFSVEEIEAEFARLLGRPLDTGKKG